MMEIVQRTKGEIRSERGEILSTAHRVEKGRSEEFPRDKQSLIELAESCSWIAAGFSRGTIKSSEDLVQVVKALARVNAQAFNHLLQVLNNGGEIPKI